MGRQLPPFRGLTQDVRIGIRQLRATPVVTAVAILSLALGIGANTALFALANSLLLRPLPVKEPDRLVMISDTGTTGTRYWEVRVWQQFHRWEGPFEAICAWAATRLTHSEGIEAQPIAGGWVSGSYFETLGLRAALGRMRTDADDIDALKEQGRGAAGATGGGVPDALVIAQIALSVVLVVAAGLFVRTVASLAARDPGFSRDSVLVARLDSRRAIADTRQRIGTYEHLREAVRLVPGVSDAALSVVTPVGNLAFDPPIDVSGGRALSLRERQVYGNIISPGWFNTFGVPLIAGRDLTAGDRVGTELVAIVNPAFSHRFLNDANPLDHFITLPAVMLQPSPNVPIRIVGVVADAVYGSLREPPQPTMYLPMAQHQGPFFLRNSGTVNLNIRAASASPALLAKSVAEIIRSVNPQLAVTFRPLAEQLSDSLARERVVATLAGFFGALALLLAGLGLYGVTAYAVARRRAEIGIRMALGATPLAVIRLVMNRVALLGVVGVVTGAVVSVWASRFVAFLLYGVESRDVSTLVGAALVLAFVAGLAGGVPAYRASRLDAADVLRQA